MPVAAGGVRASDLEQIELRDWLSGNISFDDATLPIVSVSRLQLRSIVSPVITTAVLITAGCSFNMPYSVCSHIVWLWTEQKRFISHCSDFREHNLVWRMEWIWVWCLIFPELNINVHFELHYKPFIEWLSRISLHSTFFEKGRS